MRALPSLLLLVAGCITHLPVRTTAHLRIHWEPNYEAALTTAARTHKPLLVLLVAGELAGPSWYGGDALRSAALADERVIALINERLVPVWINVRRAPLPPFAFTDQFLLNGRIDERRMIKDPFSEGFFLRSLVVTPDGATLLNPQPPTVVGASWQFFSRGDVSYAQIDTGDYLSMLNHALANFDQRFASK